VFGPEVYGRSEREKRKILEPVVEATFGVKSVLLNVIFGVTLKVLSLTTLCPHYTVQGLLQRIAQHTAAVNTLI
jgi:hypothetical protein